MDRFPDESSLLFFFPALRGRLIFGRKKGKMNRNRATSKQGQRCPSAGRQRQPSSPRLTSKGRAKTKQGRTGTGQRRRQPSAQRRAPSAPHRPAPKNLDLSNKNAKTDKISIHKYSPLEFAESVVKINPDTGILERLEKFRMLKKKQIESFHTTASRISFDNNRTKNRYPGT